MLHMSQTANKPCKADAKARPAQTVSVASVDHVIATVVIARIVAVSAHSMALKMHRRASF